MSMRRKFCIPTWFHVAEVCKARVLQVLSELIISNESRIQESKNVQYYNKMRVFHFTACIRYMVSPESMVFWICIA